MDLLYKEATENTPFVSFNFKKGLFILEGQCTLDEPESFFTSIENHIRDYIKQPAECTILTLLKCNKYFFFKIPFKHRGFIR